jgi:hypothetical protein
MEVSGQLHAPAALPQGRSPSYSFDRRLAIQIETKERFGSTKDEMTLHSVE